MKPLHLTLIFIWAAASLSAQSTITRGTEPGEIYISSNWYVEGAEMHTAIWRSTDHGQTLNLQYRSTTAPPNGTMGIGKVLGDATPGALYGIAGGELWVSFDYGASWTSKDSYTSSTIGQYISGNCSGIVYKTIVNESMHRIELYKSIENGTNFFSVNDSTTAYWGDVGFLKEDVHLLKIIEWPEFNLGLLNSSNYGNNFDFVEIDSSIEGHVLYGHYPLISRGAITGELYLVTWHLPANYYIYYSNDYGQTFQLQYQSEECDFDYWGYYFSAGREPGSFYVKRIRATEDMQHMLMYIDYSADSAQTFTSYFHELDETYGIEELGEQIAVVCYPNPFNESTTFNIAEGVRNDKNYIEIFDIHGKLIRRIKCSSNKLIWDGSNQNGSRVANGLYFYRINSFNYISKLNKILFVNQ